MDRNDTCHASLIERSLLDRHGPLMNSKSLVAPLGFSTGKALSQARRRGRLGVPTFVISGRKGFFALTADVARWISAQAGTARWEA
jgi:hypothetical protein